MTCCFLLVSLTCAVSAHAAENVLPKITPATAGPYHVRGNRILDANAREHLIRGTQLPPITLNAPFYSQNAFGFGPFSGTTFISIRQRMNMNAVRLRVRARDYEADERYRVRVKEIVQQANQFELLAILELDLLTSAPAETVDSFWAHCAAEFKTSPNVFFALSSVDNAKHLVEGIRSSGADQPIIVANGNGVLEKPNIIYEVSPSYASVQTDQKQFGAMSERVALLPTDWTLNLTAQGRNARLSRASREQHPSWSRIF